MHTLQGMVRQAGKRHCFFPLMALLFFFLACLFAVPAPPPALLDDDDDRLIAPGLTE